jgi:hypothetical protein
LKTAHSGDKIILKEGIYREQVSVPSGITIAGAPGERAVISGAEKPAHWEKFSDHVYVATIDWQPSNLLVDSCEQKVARQPNESWWVIPHYKAGVASDPEHLKTFKDNLTGADIALWLGSPLNYFPVDQIKSFDPNAGTITLAQANNSTKGQLSKRLKDNDHYYLRNHHSLIDIPGEWAVEKDGSKFKLYFYPVNPGDLEIAEAPKITGAVVGINGAKNVRLENIEVRNGIEYGILLEKSDHVVIDHCVIHHNDKAGVHMEGGNSNVEVTKSLIWLNWMGIGFGTGTKNGLLENCDVGYNKTDGVHVSAASDITLKQNYIHHHVLIAHPDNIQLHRGVKNVNFIENLCMCSAQSIMMEDTSDGEVRGNIFMGSTANTVMFGGNNFKFSNNTFAYSVNKCLQLFGKNYQVNENVFMKGNPGAVYTPKDPNTYTGDHNLVFTLEGGAPAESGAKGKPDPNSISANPQFLNAPISYCALDLKQNTDCTADTWIIKDVGLFHVDDVIEVNFDGIPRKITNISGNKITVTPALRNKPFRNLRIANWGKDKKDLQLDLRTSDQSPAAKLGKAGAPAGSKICIKQYQDGDFNGDGKRDIPVMPADILKSAKEVTD